VLDREQVFQAGHEYLGIPCHASPRRLSQIARFLRDNRKGVQKAKQFIEEKHVSLVIGLGGYASVPSARAATRCGVPLVLLEQNVYPGRATRWLARSAALMLLAFRDTKEHLRTRGSLEVPGNPVRSEFLAMRSEAEATDPVADNGAQRRLLILGGSNGAGELNEQVPRALYRCREQLQDWQITHQSGETQHAATEELYRKLGIAADVIPFVANMATTLAKTDAAISRSGGTTLAELAVSHVPSVLCPLASATDDHQRLNAEYYASRRAAVLVPSSRISAKHETTRQDVAIADALLPLLTSEAERTALATGMARLARPNASLRAAESILKLVRPTRSVPPPLGSTMPSTVESRF